MHEARTPVLETAGPVHRGSSTAAAIFERACDLGDAEACQHLGVRYYQGNGRSKDFKRARELLDRACTGKHPGPARSWR